MNIGSHKAQWLLAALLIQVALAVPMSASAPVESLKLSELPERFETRIPALLEEQLADVERAAAALPGMDRKRAYLITLPLQNYIEDVVLSANRPAALHPRAMAWVIGTEAARGTREREISRLLVTYYQKDLFKTFDVNRSNVAATEASKGGDR